ESNLLVLDEPTNDLDMETLDLLQDMLANYDGTLIVISHDRDFLDQLVSSVIVIEDDGKVEEYVGGYTDYSRQSSGMDKGAAKKKPLSADKSVAAKPKAARTKLSYKDQRDLDRLPGVIEDLERKINALEDELADPDLFTKLPGKFKETADALPNVRQKLEEAEERWLELEILQEEIAG
ncbi:MAG: hypothetical protein JKX94_04610, partial [Sneathiella sp.]|nr:hypothetical protein [Sneathiella sp.]